MRRALSALLLALLVLGSGSLSGQSEFVMGRFEASLDSLRRQAGIPGLSAAVVVGREIAWEQAFGLADVERGIPVQPDTPFYLADLTQPFTSTLLLECVEEGRLRLDQPVHALAATPDLPAGSVAEVLSHWVAVPNAPVFRYSPARYATLTSIVEGCAQESFRRRLFQRIIGRFGMAHTVPGPDFPVVTTAPAALQPGAEPEFLPEHLAAFGRLVQQMAKPYRLDRRGRPAPGTVPTGGINAAVGLVSTTRDLWRFDAALTSGALLMPQSLARAWTLPLAGDTPFNTPSAPRMGLGWFVQQHQGEPLVWHFGHAPDTGSALVLKLPRRQVTLILLANSDGLSAGYSLSAGDVTKSPFARLFLSIFG
jgi:CubicO group peptidase (beta-lactamase class C family)